MSDMQENVNVGNEICVFRDVQIAQEIRSLAALGVFPKGILVYGLVYYQLGKRYYMISTDPANLITFLNQAENIAFFPTPIESYAERRIIPEGEEEEIIQQVKLKLARQLQAKYPLEVFQLLERMSQYVGNQLMEVPLQTYREDLESVFVADKIIAFRDLCIRSYWRKNISALVYHQLLAWCDKRLAQMADDIPPMGNQQKQFYGFAVLDGQNISRCVINANLSCIYQEKSKLEQQGYFVTAWHQRIFTVERQESLRSVNHEMTAFLSTIYDDSLIALIKQMEEIPSGITQQSIHEMQQELENYGQAAQQLGKYYAQIWGITQEKE